MRGREEEAFVNNLLNRRLFQGVKKRRRWRFASKDEIYQQGERSRRGPASPSRRTCPTGAPASFRRCPVRVVAASVCEDPRPSRAAVPYFLDGCPDVGLRHVLPERPLLAGL